MAEEKKLSARLTQQYTGGKVADIQSKLAALQPQMQDWQSKIAAQEQSISDIGGGTANEPHLSSRRMQTIEGRRTELSQMQQNLRNLQSQQSQYQSQLADPSSLLSDRERDQIRGATFGETLLGEEGLGRLGTDVTMQGIGERFKSLSKGFSSEEQLARREQALEGLQGQEQAQQRALQARLARAGVKGGQAGAQTRDLAIAGMQQRSNMERDLLIANREAEASGLRDYAKFTGEVKKFDLGQAAKEKDIVLQSAMGESQIGSSERVAKAQADASARAAASRSAAACFPAGTLVDMKDGKMAIEDIEVGDELANGAYVQIVGEGSSNDFYLWRGTVVTGEHVVHDGTYWLKVKNATDAVSLDLPQQPVYNMYVEGNELTINENRVADFASLWTMGGINAWIYNGIKSVHRRGLRYFSKLVEKMGLGATPIKVTAKNRVRNEKRR